MLDVDEVFILAACDFETAGAFFKETEDVLYALKVKLDACSERLAELAHNEPIFSVKSDKSVDSTQPPDSNSAEDTPQAFEDKFEVCFNHLTKLSTDKSVSDSQPLTARNQIQLAYRGTCSESFNLSQISMTQRRLENFKLS